MNQDKDAFVFADYLGSISPLSMKDILFPLSSDTGRASAPEDLRHVYFMGPETGTLERVLKVEIVPSKKGTVSIDTNGGIYLIGVTEKRFIRLSPHWILTVAEKEEQKSKDAESIARYRTEKEAEAETPIES